MTAVSPGDQTVAFIRQKIRRLTTSSSESALSTASIDQYINNFYNSDFPYAIKIDQQRFVYTFYTRPYIDRYPVDVNYCQGFRAPLYVEGILGTFFKDRTQFYNLWPRWPTKFQQGNDTITGNITAIAQPTNPTQITSTAHNLTTGAVITISSVGGMTQLNGNTYTITVIDANTFSLDGIDNTAFGAYTSGGSWTTIDQSFSFTIPGPFLSKEVVIGGVDSFGNAISINDDGNGNLQYITPNPQTTVPPYTDVYTSLNAPTASDIGKPIPGMHNQNTGNPGLNTFVNIGTVDYVTGLIDFLLPGGVSLAAGTLLTVWVSQYQTGRPYCAMYWNNEITIRPVPKLIHKIEIEVYMTPVQFMLSTDNPIVSQWAQYLAYGASMEILRDRQDMEGVENLREGFMRQEGLVLERQGIEEIGQPNYQLFNSTQAYSIYGGFGGTGWV
jgi:hypothetical protein